MITVTLLTAHRSHLITQLQYIGYRFQDLHSPHFQNQNSNGLSLHLRYFQQTYKCKQILSAFDLIKHHSIVSFSIKNIGGSFRHTYAVNGMLIVPARELHIILMPVSRVEQPAMQW